ncbi:sorting nexin-11 isoform X3 [Gymnodraco acuticeps]|uniref:Sorting nexin-11 isoform X2 n=1 Tax=Gymnodraco acuticeps TaxID=8218 RepID=A0A6P8U9H2_GYMAC|nr:sorting nexin-11 isoform X2 [Gymnodraco acuticeps]XP_034073459.1 sorting nexin-11 isoform X3 [Gymnodraco acuticeps]
MINNQEEDEFVAVRVQDPRVQNEGSWNSFVDYKIFLHTNSKAFTAKTSCVRRRYSEFSWLKKKLQKNTGLVPVPDLPAKSFFSFINEDFLERRRKGLQAFLDSVVNMTVCLSDSQLHLFLQTQLPVGHILDCVQGHTPYSVTDAILTYVSSNRGYAQAQEDDPIKESSLTISYESMESPVPHQPCLQLKETCSPELLSCVDSEPQDCELERDDKDTVEFLYKENSSVMVLQGDNHLEAIVEDCVPSEATFYLGESQNVPESLSLEEQTQQKSCQIQTPVEVHSPMNTDFQEKCVVDSLFEECSVREESDKTVDTEDMNVPHPDTEEKVVPHPDTEEKVVPHPDTEEKVVPHPDTEEKVVPHPDTEEKVVPHPDTEEKVVPHPDTEEKVVPHPDTEEKVVPHPDTEEKVVPHPDTEEKVVPHPDTEEKVVPHPDTEEKVVPHPDTEEKVVPHPDTEEKVVPHPDTEEKVVPHPDTEEKVVPHPDTEEKVVPHPDTEEKVVPHPDTEEKVVPHPDTEEKVVPHPDTEEKVVPHPDTEEKVVPHPDTEEKVVPHPDTEEKVVPHPDTEEKVVPHPDTEEKVVPHPDTEEKVEHCESSVEANTEKVHFDFKDSDLKDPLLVSATISQEEVLEVCFEKSVLENHVISEVNGLEHVDTTEAPVEDASCLEEFKSADKEMSDEPERKDETAYMSEIHEETDNVHPEVEGSDDGLFQHMDQVELEDDLVEQEVDLVRTKDDSDEDSQSSSNESIVKVSDEESICDEAEELIHSADGHMETPHEEVAHWAEEVQTPRTNILDLHVNGCIVEKDDILAHEEDDLQYITEISDLHRSLDLISSVTGGVLTENSDFSILERSCTPELADSGSAEKENVSLLSLDASNEAHEVEVL